MSDTNRGERIFRGNCLEVLPTFKSESINFVLTDPPYLVNYQDRSGRKVANDDNADWLEPAFGEIARVLEKDSFCVSFYGWSKIDLFFKAWRKAGLYPVGNFHFPKRYTSSTRFVREQSESAFLLAKGRPQPPAEPLGNVVEWTYSGNKLHPTQKPVGTLIPLIDTYSRPDSWVLDPFAGSGSTCVAAKMLGRRYVGIEMDALYHTKANERMEGYQTFFAGKPNN